MTDSRDHPAEACTSSGTTSEDELLEDEYGLPLPSPALRAAFEKTDALLTGLEGDERRRAVATLYHDAEGNPQLRRLRIRAVPDA